MLKETKEFIQQNSNLINNAEWDKLYNKFNSQFKVRGFLNIPVMIQLTRMLIECGINLNNNYSITDMEKDISILKTLNAENFTAPEAEDEDVWAYLYDQEIGKALTNILRASRIISQDDCIPGDGDYRNLRICIYNVYDRDVMEDILEHNYANYHYYVEIQLCSEDGVFLYPWGPQDSISFHISKGADSYYLKEDDNYFDSLDNVLKDWVNKLLPL